MSVSTATKKLENYPASVVEILSSELSSIAREIEQLPESGFGNITPEQMVWMQQIDFCSQRLVEVSKLMKHLEILETKTEDDLPEVMRTSAKLEHVRKLFG